MDKANKNELIAVAAYMHIKRTELAKRFCNQKRYKYKSHHYFVISLKLMQRISLLYFNPPQSLSL